tara:strand:+ start:45 stop:317 length:273 start_codon:yes stop_codon:yes gene_type:complete
MYEAMFMSNQYLHKTTFGEAINEWLTTEEPVVSVSEHYTVTYDTDYSGDVRIKSISDENDTVLWENWNSNFWTEAEDKLISEILLWGQLI